MVWQATTVGAAPVNLSEVQSTFGGSGLLSSYNRGGSYVKNIANSYPLIGTSVPISLVGFADTYNPPVDMPTSGGTSSSSSISGALARVYFYAANGAIAYYSTSLGWNSNVGSWLLGTGDQNDFQIHAYQTELTETGGGGSKNGTLNSWISLNNTGWWVSVAGSESQITSTWGIQITIRDKATSTNCVTGNFTLTAENFGIS